MEKLTVTIECTERIAILKPHRTIAFCDDCQTDKEMLSFDEAVLLSGIGALSIISLIQNGMVHSTETATGHLLVCGGSLMEF